MKLDRGLRYCAAMVLAMQAAGSDAASRCGDAAQRPWCDTTLSASQRSDLLLASMTLSQKIGMMAGDDALSVINGTPATGVVDGIPALGIPTLYMSDGPVGPREGKATAMPSPLALGASFDPALARRVGAAIANEVRYEGNDLLHGPSVDVMRTPLSGRAFETYGEDPLLSSRIAPQWIIGAQSEGVIANVKHFAVYTQEGQIGVPPVTALIGGRQLVNALIDERTLRELYLPPFEAAVQRGEVGSLMCAYHFVNSAPACSSAHLLEDILRQEWGFDGFVVSDYYLAVKDTVLSARNGLEIEMPIGTFYTPLLLELQVRAGLIPVSTIDQRVGNILRTLFRFGFFDRADFPSDDTLIDQPAHARVARDAAERGMVLLRNTGVLPLDARQLRRIAVIGEPATRLPNGGGSSAVVPFQFVTPLDAITQRAGSGIAVSYDDGRQPASATALAAKSDVVLVFVADKSSEGVDKRCLSLDCPLLGRSAQDRLIEAVAAANPNTVVMLEIGGPVLTPWREHVAAILSAWYPGQEAGAAMARVLFGDTDPGGRLPVSFPAAEKDTATAGHLARYPGLLNQAFYSEGIFTGYRWHDANNVAPAYAFGFGLSYTQFETGELEVSTRRDGGLRVAMSIRNAGSRAGWAVAQLYLGLPSPSADVAQPVHALKGFDKQRLQPGESQRLQFDLDPRALSYWDIADNRWRVAAGCYSIDAGSSSRELPLHRAMNRAADSSWSAGCP
ncbi:MAG: glycosyl hydrolase [Hydrocarboniphaga sp.]|uniref:beta-glucosidase family protein n=1 Tax=Hydrocarboniphaga sp. TaxID=2033016 RepID=UPI002607AE36|nr:glycoside hydrolase family 3 C-terminal domain-containing protein [Hydrocarboniphaga sp.]MDB5968103.1 glycosyl hydrolase [Hydrocarboniphaga sp.]